MAAVMLESKQPPCPPRDGSELGHVIQSAAERGMRRRDSPLRCDALLQFDGWDVNVARVDELRHSASRARSVLP